LYVQTRNEIFNPGITPEEWRAQVAGKNKNLDWLKPDNLPANGTTRIRVVGDCFTVNGDYGFKINMTIKLEEDKKQYKFGVKHNNPGLVQLINDLAAGKPTVVQRAEYKGNEYVQIVTEDDDKPAPAKAPVQQARRQESQPITDEDIPF